MRINQFVSRIVHCSAGEEVYNIVMKTVEVAMLQKCVRSDFAKWRKKGVKEWNGREI